MYESKGITIDDIRYQAEVERKTVVLPENFYTQINKGGTEKKEEDIHGISGLKETVKLFYDEAMLSAKAKIVKKLGKDAVVLNKTIFYPEMGGQKPDGGTINGINVVNVIIRDGVIIHYLEKALDKSAGDTVSLNVNPVRREALRKHHTATHIINRAARMTLGGFVYQNGAEKDVDKAHLDITYYDKLTTEQLNAIEALANETVSKNLKISVSVMGRTSAEMKYGMGIYQGGAIPNAKLRMVEIDKYDVEACGGLHCHMTGDVNFIKIIKSERIQDGVVRLTFMADKPALKYVQEEDKLVKDLMSLWGVKQEEVYKTADRFFSEAKHYRQLYESAESERIEIDAMNKLKSADEYEVQTNLDNMGLMMRALKRVMKDLPGKSLVISSENVGLGYPKNDSIKNQLSSRYKETIDRGEFWFGHN